MGQFEKHVFVCTTGKVCPRQGSVEVHSTLRGLVAKAGLKERIRVNKCGCVAQCGYGPMLTVYPEGTWYSAVRPDDVEELFQSLLHGRPVERLLYQPPTSGVHLCPEGEEVVPVEPLED